MRDFLKQVLASFVGLFLFCTLGLGALIALLAVISLTSKSNPPLADKTVLMFDLSTSITDAPPNIAPGQVVRGVLTGSELTKPVGLRAVINTLNAAAADQHIVGLYLYGNIDPANPGFGFATLSELRQALVNFRKSGKPIFAYNLNWAERDYYLTSVATTLLLNPTGALEMNGLRAETPFFGGALQKYGIGIQVARVGQYKSAIEPFTRRDRSPADRQQTQKLLTDIWSDVIKTAAASRKLNPEALQAIADRKGLLTATEAREAGLIDRIAYEDEVVQSLQKLTGKGDDPKESFRQIDLTDYVAIAAPEQHHTSDRRVALVYAEGEIVNGAGEDGEIGGDTLTGIIRDLRLDDQVKAIVLRVNSVGGSGTASDQIAREIKLTKQVKPVIVSMGSVAASGGYAISTYASKIFALPNTITGSIGVFAIFPNIQKIANSNGLTWDVVKTGQYADLETITRPKTPQELAILQRFTNQFYDQFLANVSTSRSLPRQKVAEIAQGRVWSGSTAKQLGLVDDLGGLETAIQAAVTQAKLGNDWQLDEYPKNHSLGGQFLQGLLSQTAVLSTAHSSTPHPDALTRQFKLLQTDLETLRSLNDPVGVYARMLFIPKID
jgi:protease-4